ncbi:bacteriophage holin [Saccharopolyspora sp. TS4A08]|uniref:Bacteriophage holin n=1 Tax=Saccharopolyspora ipomoeae TaxID=3042027 RepID=A0ABT6PGZ5_9PSEU|nr:bacteriophage holin [Saccharopolyspora sp. TS4A08]MDI2027268.1 bacteriophage holin [Saccharopolyspora sp. TS4A08]
MPFVWTLVLLAAGLVLLVFLLVRTLLEVRRFQRAQRSATSALADRSGMVKARVAGLKVAISQRRRG